MLKEGTGRYPALPRGQWQMSRWHSRGYLPHWEVGEFPQAITFRLANSLPSSVLAQWQSELAGLPDDLALVDRRRRIERALDRGHGEPLLAIAKVADLVENALLHFDGQRYRLHAWSIMPNHVHAVATPLGVNTLSAITHSWKSFTATLANRMLGRSESFWAPEYFDRAIRNRQHFSDAVNYAEMNPVVAGLCEHPEDWRHSSAWRERK